jgi:calcineurin-like phosphoesterase family protein
MIIKRTLESLDNCKDIVYLAGPTHRITDNQNKLIPSYRDEIIDIFKKLDFKGTLVIPEWINNKKPSDWSYNKQVNWEKSAMYQASKIMFWIPRNLDTLPAFTTNIEFGEWLNSGKIIVGSPVDAVKNDYLKARCKQLDINWYSDLFDICKDTIDFFKKPIDIFFTSDTHFSQERTLEFSKRLFFNTEEMDNNLISNWNKEITSNDTVFHLGDVGNLSIIKKLNFKKLYLLLGNYERDSDLSLLNSIPNIHILESKSSLIKLKLNDNTDEIFELVHEPENRKTKNFCLFAHVHQLSMIKSNALNVGIDTHRFSPINLNTVLFYKNAITKHYDNNVFMNYKENVK